MAERHSGTIVRLYADEGGTILVDMLKAGHGTTLFTFELPRSNPGGTVDIQLQFLQTAMVHGLHTVLTETNRRITHVEINRFA